MRKVTSFEQACEVLGLNPLDLPKVEMLPEKHQKCILAHYKLVTIAEAVNEGWKPNYHDGTWNYYPFFGIETTEENKSGVGFSYSDCDNTYANTYLGSRLCFPDCATAVWFGETYQDLFKDYLLFN